MSFSSGVIYQVSDGITGNQTRQNSLQLELFQIAQQHNNDISNKILIDPPGWLTS